MKLNRLAEILEKEIEMFHYGLTDVKRLNAIANASKCLISCAVLELETAMNADHMKEVKDRHVSLLLP